MTTSTFFRARALEVRQPLATFYVASIPARTLMAVAYSDVVEASIDEQGDYHLSGSQRVISDERLSQIAKYISREDATFPNSIVLAANFLQDGWMEEEAADPNQIDTLWRIEQGKEGEIYIVIPTQKRLASIIDGQHRLFAFSKILDQNILNMELVCAIFFDMPKAMQAQVFATINSTQRQVPKALTYQLYGYNIEDEHPSLWSPEKFAVFLTRRLHIDPQSPLCGRISMSPRHAVDATPRNLEGGWEASFATIVSGILRLICSDPKSDMDFLRTLPKKTRSELPINSSERGPPLRTFFIMQNDKLIYSVILEFIIACDTIFWKQATPDSFITRTVGLQALFDVLRKIVLEPINGRYLGAGWFEKRLKPAAALRFDTAEYRVPSGVGRQRIRRAMEECLNYDSAAEG
jgi:DNA phosphorothioation-associated DGQHR protein 1